MHIDSRWGDSDKLPLSNGPITFRTPPGLPRLCLASNGTQVSYQLSYPIHIVDDAPWPPIQVLVSGRHLTISKPLVIASGAPTEQDTESPDFFWTNLNVNCPERGQLTAANGWEVVHSLLGWLRIKCRHYWLLHGSTGFGARYRTTIYERAGFQVSQQNSVGYGSNVIVRPLSREIWESCGTELSSAAAKPLSDSLYCDALLSLSAGDTAKAVVEAAVATEVAITQLLTDAAQQLPSTQSKAKFLERERSGKYARFGEKMKDWPQAMGLRATSTYCPAGFPPAWLADAELLYRERNLVAHSGVVSATTDGLTLSRMVFAANATLQYCREQRLELGLNVFDMPTGQTPFRQTLCFVDGAFASVTNKVEGWLTQEKQ